MADNEDFLAELNAEFGKKPKQSKQKNLAADLAGQTFVGTSDYRLQQLMQESNEIAKNGGYGPNWQASARVTWMTQQHCRTCGSTVEFISGEYVRFENTRARATVTRRLEACTDQWHFGNEEGVMLPEEFTTQEQSVARCVGCIVVERQAQEIWNHAVKVAVEEQAELDLEIPGL